MAAGVGPSEGAALTANQRELHGQVIATARQLAAEVGDSSQLCDAVAAVLRRHPGGGGAAGSDKGKEQQVEGLTIECCLAAIGVLPELRNRVFPERGFPSLLVLSLSPLVLDVSAPARPLAVKMLTSVLSAVAEGGAPAADERTALSALSTAFALAAASWSGPRELEAASRLSAAATARDAQPGVQLQVMKGPFIEAPPTPPLPANKTNRPTCLQSRADGAPSSGRARRRLGPRVVAAPPLRRPAPLQCIAHATVVVVAGPGPVQDGGPRPGLWEQL